MTEYLELIITIYSLSSILFKYQLGLYVPVLSIICASVGCFYTFFPLQVIVDKYFTEDDKDEEFSYDVTKKKKKNLNT